ncbi:hypothetical protein O9992_09815 [Vibrio lentus]|nr:hypothetical protein [Vibrio lentus]
MKTNKVIERKFEKNKEDTKKKPINEEIIGWNIFLRTRKTPQPNVGWGG